MLEKESKQLLIFQNYSWKKKRVEATQKYQNSRD